MGEITVNKANRPKGSLVGVPGLGQFENGSKHTVDDNVLKRYKERRNIKGEVVFGKKLSGGGKAASTSNTNTGDEEAS